MSIPIPVPGELTTRGTLAFWLVADGAVVNADDPLFEVTTESQSHIVSAPAAGKITILVVDGSTVYGGVTAATLEPETSDTKAGRAAPVSPAAKRLFAELGLDTGKGSAPTGGLRAAAESASPTRALGPKKPPETPPVEPVRETPKTITTTGEWVTTFNEVDVSAIQTLREKYNPTYEKKHGIKLGFMSFFLKAAVTAIRETPSVAPDEQNRFDIAITVSTEKGLIAPVIRKVDQHSFSGLEKAISDVAVRARDGKLTLSELNGGSFTISNGGAYGSLLSTPIPNAAQQAILGIHTIQKRAVVIDETIVVRPMMYLALSYDPRSVDERDAVRFLVRIKECVERPERLFLDI